MSKQVWRVLVVDDREAEDINRTISGNVVLGENDEIVVTTCLDFNDAIENIKKYRFDLTILDLKDDDAFEIDEGSETAGEKVFNEIKSLRFMPIIFYSAVAHRVENLASPFVKVVRREGAVSLRPVIKKIFDTKIPHLLRHLEEEQRNYMWDQLSNGSKYYSELHDSSEVAYLLARRLGNVLESSSVKRFLSSKSPTGLPADELKLHPIEMYIFPPLHNKMLSGDIVKFTIKGTPDYTFGVIITPSCDFQNNKIAYILIAKCEYLSTQEELKAAKKYWDDLKHATATKGNQPNQAPRKQLENLIKSNRKDTQEGRFHFLPGTFFLPDLVIDFKNLITIPENKICQLERIASIDNPFAEAIIAKFSKFYSRIGLPEVDFDEVLQRLQKEHDSESDGAMQ